jgi:hypothetical protein
VDRSTDGRHQVIIEHCYFEKQFILHPDLIGGWVAFMLTGIPRSQSGAWWLFNDCEHDWCELWRHSNTVVCECSICERKAYRHASADLLDNHVGQWMIINMEDHR